MDLSNHYTTPKLFGDYYYNKPPLYNWILLFFFKIFGESNEFVSRLPTVNFLLIYAATIFYYSKKHFSKKLSFINALGLITCGRILFYDSFLGLIDICFSWVIYLIFMVIYHKFQQGKFFQLFSIAYFLAALAFLLKGLPVIAFLGITLFVYFAFQSKVLKLFSFFHLLGILIFTLIVGGYYFAYSQYNDLESVFYTLFNESAKRTLIAHGWQDTIAHVFAFPFEMVYHFLPWTVLVIYFFQKNVRQQIKKNSFVSYNLLVFIATIPLYWFSAEVYPRYLFMQIPLIFTVLFYLHSLQEKAPKWQFKFITCLFGMALLFAPVTAIILPFFVENIKDVSYFYLKLGLILLAFSIIARLYFSKNSPKFLIFILGLLVMRVGFNWFILPSRKKVERTTVCKESAIRIGKKYVDVPIYIYRRSLGNPATGYYLTRERQEILKNQHENFDKNAIYIISTDLYPEVKFTTLDTLEVHYQNRQLMIGQLE
jgi:4-amino-4-deoxy-L-arabinose transferase-like glycosyltransferase